MKKLANIVKVILVLLILAILVLFLLNKFGFGFGNGLGFGIGDTIQNSDTSSRNVETSEENVRGTGSSSEELPLLITVTIREDKVYVEDKEIGSAEELKDYIESINTDEREYRLVDENSIRATYEWVTGVFDELKIPISQE